MKRVFLVFFVLLLLLAYLLISRQQSGFRGEAIGGRTGGDAYSGAGAQLDPGMP
jgi:hypothetical protein